MFFEKWTFINVQFSFGDSKLGFEVFTIFTGVKPINQYCRIAIIFYVYMYMLINQNFILFLPLLYFSLALGFHKNIQTSSNVLCVNKILSLYETNETDILSYEPFSDILLPYLNTQDKMILAAGEMIEKQERNGLRGTGLVIVDIQSSPDVVFDTLTRFAMYQEMIPIVRSSKIISSDGVNSVVEFVVSQFLLRVNVIHTVVKHQRLVKFTLDTNRANPVFREAEGFWHVQIPADRPEGYCRVYLSAQILTHKFVPTLIIDYAAARALPEATKWLKPFFTPS
jgi:ribosome-associated toxin RatA of RatAB toxin-antitoxin module